MSEIKVQVNNGPAAEMPAPVTVAEALKKLDRDLAKQALAARVNGHEVDLAYRIESQANGDAVKIEPVLPQTRDGLDVLRHSTAHLLAAAVLDLFPGRGKSLPNERNPILFCDRPKRIMSTGPVERSPPGQSWPTSSTTSVARSSWPTTRTAMAP